LSAARRSKYRHVSEGAFICWLRTIARRRLFHQLRALEPAREPGSLTCEEGSESDEAETLIEPGRLPYRMAEQSELLSLLDSQFDELLTDAQPNRTAKEWGRPRKRAFIRFYIEGLSHREILTAALEDAKHLKLGITIGRPAINN
jgi:DNA-directed RNA polymerase specialized sigma24 family protein